MRFCVFAVLAAGMIILLLSAGCADINVKKKAVDFGTSFGGTTEEQKAIDWFKATYGDPMTNNDQPARFIEPVITSGIDKNSLPTNKVTTFPVSGGSVYFFVIYDNFKKGDPITVSWIYLDNGKEITNIQEQAGGDFGRFIAEIQKPDNGWGKGNQRITVISNGATASVDFVIGDALQTEPLPYNPAGGQSSARVTGKQGVTTTVTTLTSAVNGGSAGKTASGVSSAVDQGRIVQAPSGPCRDGQATCNGRCTDLNNDITNCGACNNICNLAGVQNAGQRCDNGICSCPSGLSACNGNCVDLKTDVKNCGTCGNLCPKMAYPHSIPRCGKDSNGNPMCGFNCEQGYTRYFGGSTVGCFTEAEIADFRKPETSGPCEGYHTDLLHIWQNCNGKCVNLVGNNDNCGSCGSHCPPATTCSGLNLCCSPLGCVPAL